jgi:hypothetical protein
MRRWLFLFILFVAVTGCVGRESTVRPSNRVAIVIDASGSYKARQVEAVERAVALLDGMVKTHVKRWESKDDVIAIISLDASPDVIWKGSLQDLKSRPPAFWKERFLSRTDYAGCTDVAKAFRLAGRVLEGDSRSVSKYLFVFSDLIHEPPLGSMRACQAPKGDPPEDFPWSALSDVSMSVFWMPAEQKLRWTKAVEERGLSESIGLHTVSESARVAIPAPPRAKIKVSEEERQADREGFFGILKTAGLTVAGCAGFLIVGMSGLLFFRRHRARRQPRRPAFPAQGPTGNAGAPAPDSFRPGQPETHENRRLH